jgi:hypothetical protein
MHLLLFAFSTSIFPLLNAGQPACMIPQEKTIAEPPAAPPKTQTYFERDPRLRVPLSQRAGKTIYKEIWSQITRYTKVPIEREEAAREFDDAQIAVGYHKRPARDVMDAIAAHTKTRWERTQQNGYEYLVSEREMNSHKAKNAHQIDRYAQGALFVNELNSLSPEEQKRIRSGDFLLLHSLPQGMQRAVAGVMDALDREYIARGSENELRSSNFTPETRVQFEQKPQRGFNRYYITVDIPGIGTAGCAFTDYEEREKEKNAERARNQQAGQWDALYSPLHSALTQEEAKRLPALQKKITVQMREVTLPDILRYLHNTYGIAYVCDPPFVMQQRANVNLVDMPLGKALDRLVQLYDKTEWEWRKSNFLILRGPDNPARSGWQAAK